MYDWPRVSFMTEGDVRHLLGYGWAVGALRVRKVRVPKEIGILNRL